MPILPITPRQRSIRGGRERLRAGTWRSTRWEICWMASVSAKLRWKKANGSLSTACTCCKPNPKSYLPNRALEFDRIAIGIEDIHGRSRPFGAVALAGLHDLDAVRGKMREDFRFVERSDLDREMIEVAALVSRSRAAALSQHALERNEIDQRSSGAHLDEADALLALVDAAAEHVAIEVQTRREILDAQHDVIDRA